MSKKSKAKARANPPSGRQPMTVVRSRRVMMAQDTAPRSFAQMFPPAPAPPGVPREAQLAMDEAMSPIFGYAQYGAIDDGMSWLGFPYLAELLQRPEYRMIVEVRAKEMTRKGFELTYTGEEEAKAEKRLAELDRACKSFRVLDHLRIAAEHDGAFGGAQLYIDTGASDDPAELATKLVIDKAKIRKGGLRGFRAIEPMWSYPGQYNSTDPLHPNFFRPDTWYVNGKTVHNTRLLTMISRAMPDILKPAYSFRGLSLSQMAKPYVDNWLRTRQSVSDLIHSFSIIVISSNLMGPLGGGGWEDLYKRIDEFNAMRDNAGAMLADKESEDIKNLAVPLGTLDALQAQAQEQMASVAQTPLVKLLGITPSGLNACLTGETLISTDRGQVPIRDVTLSDLVMTRRGWAPLTFSGVTKRATELFEIKTSSATLRCTGNHPIWNASTNEFVPAENVQPGQRLLLIGEKSAAQKTRHPWHGVGSGGGSGATATMPHGTQILDDPFFFTGRCGKRIADLSPTGFISTILTATKSIISSSILSQCTQPTMPLTTVSTFGRGGSVAQKPFFARTAVDRLSSQNFRAGGSFVAENALSQTGGRTGRPWTMGHQDAFALCAARLSTLFEGARNFVRANAQLRARTDLNTCEHIFSHTLKNSQGWRGTPDAPLRATWPKSALGVVSSLFRLIVLASYTARSRAKIERVREDTGSVISVRKIPANEPVYDLTVAKGYLPEFFANGILTHNSSDGEIRVFYDTISALQEHLFNEPLRVMLDCIQLHLWGEIDPDIGFKWTPLWQLDDAAMAAVRKTDADTAAVYIQDGVIAAEEVRGMLIADKNSAYAGLDPDDMPEPLDDDADLEHESTGGGGVRSGESAKSERSGV